VLKSRRGLLAAGLAVAVVGALGVASTLHAGAAQIPGTAEGSAAVAPASLDARAGLDASAAKTIRAGVTAPPTILPWGSRPQRIRKGRAGASSRTLRAEGLAAAAADTSGSIVPRARYAPKGRTGKSSFLRAEKTDVVPPDPAGAPAPAGNERNVDFLYNVGSQAAETDGFYANVTIGTPKLDKKDYHTLAELALQSADGNQIVEIGWNVDRAVNGDDDPHLFVYHWVNREKSCYNACGFVQYSKSIKPGDTLTSDVTKKFGIQYFNNAWWVAFDTEWIGYFPTRLWGDEGVTFTRSGFLQLFGEVAASSEKPCTEMGNGQTPDNDTAARVSSVSFLNGPPVAMSIRSTTDVYDVAPITPRTFRYGGPGVC
jgi:neprosin-like protein